jgi:hypothetical protein
MSPSSEKLRLVAGDYAVSLVGDLPPGCYLGKLQVIFRTPSALSQHGADVAYDASGVLRTLHLVGRIVGENLVYTLTYDEFNPASGRTVITGGGTAMIYAENISGPFEGDIVNVGRQFEPVTTSCHVKGLPFVLVRGVIPS